MTESTISKYFSPVSQTIKRQKPSSSPESEDLPIDCGMGGDMEKVGELTKGQLMSDLTTIIGNLLDTKLANVATKHDLSQLSEKVDKIDTENEAQKEEITNLKMKNKVIISKLLDLESRSRRNNLIFRGLKWGNQTRDFRHVVYQFCCEVMGNNKIVINRAHPLGRDQNAIIAHIPYDPDIEYIMNRVGDLKNTGYSVYRDFPKEVRVKRACLAAVRAEVERVAGPRRMPIMFDHLSIDRRRFTWEEGHLMVGKKDGVQQLNEMFRHDFSDFVEALKQQPAGEVRGVNGGGGSGGPTGPPASQEAARTARTAAEVTRGGSNNRTAASTHNTDG